MQNRHNLDEIEIFLMGDALEVCVKKTTSDGEGPDIRRISHT